MNICVRCIRLIRNDLKFEHQYAATEEWLAYWPYTFHTCSEVVFSIVDLSLSPQCMNREV